ncbi:hypothetical protein BJ958_004064 [Nocardioides kongjuensis]|uniref:Uncharacterized protein n=1 Tax=Nocardioides kongjuensis TaxID=349522 RepID=A0A852RPL9_9ACTN|nr:hypothetical protein [Nocardioides kongjuensis]
MSPDLHDQARRLDRAERRWLADARDRLQRIRATRLLSRKQER